MDLEHEHDLVRRAASDASAFGELYDHYYPRILNYCARRTGSAEVGHDLAAETFVRALKHIGSFRWQGIPFSAWLYRIATNEVNGHFRRRRWRDLSLEALREERDFDPAGADDLEAEIIQAEEILQNQRAFVQCQRLIAELPIRYQQVLALRFLDGKQLDEISVILGKPEGTIKSLLHRGLGKLRQLAARDPSTATFSGPEHYQKVKG